MTDSSTTDAAFAGLRFARARPKTIAIWAAIQIMIGLIITLWMTVAAGPALMHLIALNAQRPPDPAASLAALRQVSPMYAGLILFDLAFYPIVYAAMCRALLRPNDDRFAYLRLGGDELRQLGLMALYIVSFIGVYIAMIIVTVVLVIISAIVVGLAHLSPSPLMALIALPIVLAIFGGFIFVGVRLSLASPLTFATGRVDLFGSWKLTRGRFWPLFGTYLIAMVLAFVGCLAFLVLVAIVGLFSGGGFGGMGFIFQPDLNSVSTALSPMRIVYLVLSGAFGAVILPLMLMPPVAIYQSLAGAAGLPGGDLGLK